MKPSIVVSTKDLAGMNIKNLLKNIHGFRETTENFNGNPVLMKDGIKVYTLNNETTTSDGIDQEIEGDWIIFATRHQAASGKKSFSVHVPGNWGKAGAGGKDKKLCRALPGVMKDAIKTIQTAYHGDEFDIVQECTHHGPEIDKPCMFIEIGSTEDEWNRYDCGEVIAKVVNHIATNKPKKYKEVVVIGGGHYNQVATKLMLNTEYAVGHICPKHMLTELNPALLKEAVEKNGENFEMVVLDWKGLATDKQRVVDMLDKLGIKYDRYNRIQKDDSEEDE